MQRAEDAMDAYRRSRLLQCAIGAVVTSAVLTAQELMAHRAGVRYQPEIVPATEQRTASLRVPAGFRVNVFAADLGAPRMPAVDVDGTVFVTRPGAGDVCTRQVVLTTAWRIASGRTSSESHARVLPGRTTISRQS